MHDMPELRKLSSNSCTPSLILSRFESEQSLSEPISHWSLAGTTYPVVEQSENQWLLLSSKELPAQCHADYQRQQPPIADIIVSDFGGLLVASFWLKQNKTLWDKKRLLLLSDYQENSLFKPVPSKILVNNLAHSATAAVPLWDDLGFASRLCHPDYPGCSPNSMTKLLNQYLTHFPNQLTIWSLGAEPVHYELALEQQHWSLNI